MDINILFLELLTGFVRGQKIEKKDQVLEEKEWEELYSLASFHHVVPMILEMAVGLDSYRTNPPAFVSVWKRETMRLVGRQIQMTAEFLRLYDELCKVVSKPLVVKGIVCRNLYRNPDYRMSGDEDLLIRREDFWKVNEFLMANGFFKDESDEELEVKLQALHEVGYRHKLNGLYLEIHLSLFPEESGAYGHFNKLFEGLFDKAVSVCCDGHTVYTLEHTEHFLYLLCHSLKHFLHSGFGVRQVFDMILFAETYGEEIRWEEIIKKTKENNMYVFLWNLLDIGVRYFAFDAKKAGWSVKLTGDLDSEDLLYDLLKGGVYGASSEERIHSSNITLAAADREEKKNGLIASLFPARSYMEKHYSYVKKHPWMLPAAWAERIIKHVGKAKGEDKNQMIESMNIGSQRVKLLKKYGVIE